MRVRTSDQSSIITPITDAIGIMKLLLLLLLMLVMMMVVVMVQV